MNKHQNAFNRLAVVIAASLAVAACSKDKSDLVEFIESTKATNVGSVKPVPQFEPYESFTYSAADLRDPFVANVELDQEPEVMVTAARESRPKQPLEQFPLDTLSMVGTLQQQSQQWALIKDPQNVVHRIQVGNYMGKNEGRVTQISETDIRLIEIVPDGIGGFLERDASIAIGGE